MLRFNGKPFIVTEQDVRNSRASGVLFACARCRGEFVAGETARWQYMPQGCPNILVCIACDTSDLGEWWSKFWPVVAWYGRRYFNDYPFKPTGKITEGMRCQLHES